MSEPGAVDLPEWPRALPADQDEVRRWHADNRAAWNQGAARYTEHRERALTRLRAGQGAIHPVEAANLATRGPLRDWCDLAIHLQCASGFDTLSLLQLGAHRVVGIDIADAHIANARWTAEALGADAEFHLADVLDPPAQLDGSADLVYTGRGAINWVADIVAWARVVARLLAPGGVVHLFDDHPVTWLFDPTEDGGLAPTGYDYHGAAVSARGWTREYIGDLGLAESELAVMHERLWRLGDVVQALLGAGLVLDHLGEHPQRYWDNYSALSEDVRAKLPMTFSVMAHKPM